MPEQDQDAVATQHENNPKIDVPFGQEPGNNRLSQPSWVDSLWWLPPWQSNIKCGNGEYTPINFYFIMMAVMERALPEYW
jgi:hypothetical protein